MLLNLAFKKHQNGPFLGDVLDSFFLKSNPSQISMLFLYTFRQEQCGENREKERKISLTQIILLPKYLCKMPAKENHKEMIHLISL